MLDYLNRTSEFDTNMLEAGLQHVLLDIDVRIQFWGPQEVKLEPIANVVEVLEVVEESFEMMWK